ncbi:MAG TPA: HAMP domain-containing sensor histidine kinase [Ktedonobacterales bacterium]
MSLTDLPARSYDPAHKQPDGLLSLFFRPVLAQRPWRDPLLLGFLLLAGLLMAFQLGMTLVQPPWKGPVTDWLRAALVWPELLVLVLTSLWLTRMRRPGSPAWWMISAGFLLYAIGQTLWGVEDQLIYPNGVPNPQWSDLFYLLQYPCFFLALALLPRLPPWGQPVITRVKVLLDCVLMIAAATALSWYFLLEPLYMQSSELTLSKITNLAYPVGDLGLLFGLALIFAYRRTVGNAVLSLLIGAVVFLTLADSWSASITLHVNYFGGNTPDLFWMACYLLFPLAGLVQVRLAQREPATGQERELTDPLSASPLGGAVTSSFRFLLPFVAALLAGGVIVIKATQTSNRLHVPLPPLLVGLALLILVIVRQELTFLEGERWRHEREAARTNELATLQEANQQMGAFLSIVSHELRTPLSVMLLHIQVLQRREEQQARPMGGGDATTEVQTSSGALLKQYRRLNRLVSDLVDVTRIQTGKMELHLERVDLVTIVREVAEEQRQAALPHRLLLHLPDDLAVPLLIDAGRIGQVVTNYLTNALKYSAEEAPVEVGVSTRAQEVQVWVRDAGPGVPLEEQERIWDRFHRVKGIEVQAGSGIGLGIGLYICRTIIERHQGRVGVVSAPGKGSTFWFALPLAGK